MSASRITADVRQDSGPNLVTVVFRDEHGVELGSLEADRVPTGVRLDLWHGDDTRRGSVVLHGPPKGDA